jgi:CTP synthase
MGIGEKNSMVIHLLSSIFSFQRRIKNKTFSAFCSSVNGNGIMADVLVCRTEHKIPKDQRAKLAQFCNVPQDNVIECKDLETIYEVPMYYRNKILMM